MELLFEQNAGRRVYLQAPKRGEKLRLVETANLNAREETERATTKEEKTLKTLQWLQKALSMENSPDRIEAFDISNTGSSDIVASMTVFVRGKPLKRDYRRFKIKTLDTQDDYHSMAEVIQRRFARYIAGDEKFGEMPDLLLIDGGDVHARTALNVIESMGIHIPVYGMVKDDRHRTRALISPDGHEVGIVANPAVFAFIGNIQEETHRFAIEYHRSLHSKNSHGSQLDNIPGVGEKRRNDLLKAFKSIKEISNASEEKLSTVVPKNTAAAVYNYFHQEVSHESDNGDSPGQKAP
jgi:excinuclease ABC subunit C